MYERKEREHLNTSKKRKASSDVTPGSIATKTVKKKKKPDGFRAPKLILFEVVAPIQHDTKDDCNKTSSIDVLGTIELGFDCYVVERYVPQSSEEDNSEDGQIVSDTSTMDSNDDDFLNTGLMSDQDDVVRIHFIESVRQRLLYKILSNDRNIYKEYVIMYCM